MLVFKGRDRLFRKLELPGQDGDGFPISPDSRKYNFLSLCENRHKSGKCQAKFDICYWPPPSQYSLDFWPISQEWTKTWNSSDLGEYRGIRRISGGSREIHSPKSASEHTSTVELHTKVPLAPYSRSSNADFGECISRYFRYATLISESRHNITPFQLEIPRSW